MGRIEEWGPVGEAKSDKWMDMSIGRQTGSRPRKAEKGAEKEKRGVNAESRERECRQHREYWGGGWVLFSAAHTQCTWVSSYWVPARGTVGLPVH